MGVDSAGTFRGTIGRTREESTPWWPERAGAPAGAPNIVIIYMDDMGFSDPGCFGSEIETPNIDALAARGLRFNHYTTHPICSPARAALLTGINAHAVSTGWLANNNPGYPGYTGEIPLDAATIAETLRARGYETIMTGKWHNTPTLDSVPSGPKHNWPAQRGFDTFYGFMEGETHFFFPTALRLNNQTVPMDEYPRRVLLDRRLDGSRHPVRQRAPGVLRNQAVLPLHRQQRRARAAPGQARRSGEVPRPLRRRLDGDPRGALPAAGRARDHPPDAKLAPSDPNIQDWDDTDPDRPPAVRPAHGSVRGDARLRGSERRQARRVPRRRSASWTTRSSCSPPTTAPPTPAARSAWSTTIAATAGWRRSRSAEERARVDDLGGPRSVSLYPIGWGQVCNTPFPTYKTYTGGGGRRVSFICPGRPGFRIVARSARSSSTLPTSCRRCSTWPASSRWLRSTAQPVTKP